MNKTVTTPSMPKPKIMEIEFFNFPSGVRKEDLLKNHSLKSYKPEEWNDHDEWVKAWLLLAFCLLLATILSNL